MTQHQKFHDEIELAHQNLTTPIITVHQALESPSVHVIKPFEEESSIRHEFSCQICSFEEVLIITSNIASIAIGIVIIFRKEIEFIPFNWLSFYFLVSFSTIVWCFIMAFALCLIGTFHKLIRRLPNPGSPFAYLPVLFLFWNYAVYIFIIAISIYFLVDEDNFLQQDMKIYIAVNLTVGTILGFSFFCRTFCIKANVFSSHLLELEKDAYQVNKEEVDKYRGEVKSQINLYQDKLKLRIPTLSKVSAEPVVIENGEYRTPDLEISLYRDPSRSIQNTRSPESIRFDQSSRRNKESPRKKSPLKLYRAQLV